MVRVILSVGDVTVVGVGPGGDHFDGCLSWATAAAAVGHASDQAIGVGRVGVGIPLERTDPGKGTPRLRRPVDSGVTLERGCQHPPCQLAPGQPLSGLQAVHLVFVLSADALRSDFYGSRPGSVGQPVPQARAGVRRAPSAALDGKMLVDGLSHRRGTLV